MVHILHTVNVAQIKHDHKYLNYIGRIGPLFLSLRNCYKECQCQYGKEKRPPFTNDSHLDVISECQDRLADIGSRSEGKRVPKKPWLSFFDTSWHFHSEVRGKYAAYCRPDKNDKPFLVTNLALLQEYNVIAEKIIKERISFLYVSIPYFFSLPFY